MKIFLDTGVLGMVTHPRTNAGHRATTWLKMHVSAGATVVIPQICDYELRREYIRNNNKKSLERLDDLIKDFEYAVATNKIWRDAADLWAYFRNIGKPPTDDTALDGDVILIATIKNDSNSPSDCVVATTNIKHLKDFVDARLYENI